MTPARFATRKFRQRRWIVLPIAAFQGQHAAFIAAPAHQDSFDLVVRQNPAGQRPAAWQDRQMAMLAKRRNANQCIMPPERAAIAIPPRSARRIGPHAVAHAELEKPRKARLRWRSDDKTLQDADTRPGLADAHHADDRVAGHQAVGVEGDHEVVVAALIFNELGHVAGLEAVVACTPAVVQPFGARSGADLPAGEFFFLATGDLGVSGVAEQEIVELRPIAPCARRIRARFPAAKPPSQGLRCKWSWRWPYAP